MKSGYRILSTGTMYKRFKKDLESSYGAQTAERIWCGAGKTG